MGRFTFGEVEAILAAANNIASEKRVAFSSRLKNLQKQGLRDSNTSPGRGRVARLGYLELIELATGVELLRLGLPPQRAASLVTKNRSTLLYTAYLATFTDYEAREAAEKRDVDPPERGYIWLFRIDGLADLTFHGASEFDDYEAGEAIGVSDIGKLFEIGIDASDDPDGIPRRHLVISGTGLCRQIVNLVAYKFALALPEELREDIEAEFDRLDALIASFKAENEAQQGSDDGNS